MTHVHVIGRTRSGKSKAIVGWVLQAINNGIGVCVIDPHGDLFIDLLKWISIFEGKKPRLNNRLIVLNPLDKDWIIGFNPLQLWPGEIPERKALHLADVITTIFQDDPTIVVRMRRLMRYTFLALIELELTLIELPQFLVNRDFRETILENITNQQVQNYWLHEFPKNDNDASMWISSTLNRLGPLVDDPDFRLLFGQVKSTINLRSIMDKGGILLVNTAKGELNEDNSRLLGAFIVAQIQQSVMTRSTLDETKRRLFWLILDEFQNYVSPTINTLLEETGKYRLSLLLAHQHLDQLMNFTVRNAVLSQCSETICFGIGEKDAEQMAKIIFKPNLDEPKHIQRKPLNWGNDVVLGYDDITWRPQAEIWELEKRRLTELPPRYFWYKKRNHSLRLYKSFELPSVQVHNGSIKLLVDKSSRFYAIPKERARSLIGVEREKLLESLKKNKSQTQNDFSKNPKTLPLWD